ncbi:MAG: hypothetical protein K0U98_18210 [Deltaproteobacteria bacterium]|nr:hypothetical protein [Deltaproteobacteria bacterium]
MKLPHPHKPLLAAAVCIVAGLLVEALTLFGNHPLAFVAFILGGGVLIGAGVLLYLSSLAFGWFGGGDR